MYQIEPIGVIETPYKEKFAVPRQPRLVPSATSRIKLLGEANCSEAIRSIEQFSHVWILFLFDQNLAAGWKPTVRPPRLGGNERVGVFASRSTFRPNGIGMSAVELQGSKQIGDQFYIRLGSVDLVDQTPIIDIKPYIPYSDSIANANGGYASERPAALQTVNFTDNAIQSLEQMTDGSHKRSVIREVLAQDPRPAYKKKAADNKEYAVHLFDLNVKFVFNEQIVTVTAIEYF